MSYFQQMKEKAIKLREKEEIYIQMCIRDRV